MADLVCCCAVGSEARLASRWRWWDVTCAMLTSDIFVLVPGHGADGLKGGYFSYMYQYVVYDSRNASDGVV